MFQTRLPVPVWVMLAALCALAAGFVYTFGVYFQHSEELIDRGLILVGSGWAGWLAWKAGPKSHSQPPYWPALSTLVVVVCLVLLIPAWYLQFADTRGRSTLLMLQYAALCGLGLSLIAAFAGWKSCWQFLFPFGFAALVLPIPTRILRPVQEVLQNITTTSAHGVLQCLQEPVTRRGFVLMLTHGDLGVAEACSGIKSLTALTAIAMFLAYYRGFSLRRAFILVGSVIPVVLVINIVRVVLSAEIQERIDRHYIIGHWHEALGMALAICGVVILMRLSSWLQPVATELESAPNPPARQWPRITLSPVWQSTFAALVLLGTALCVLSAWQGTMAMVPAEPMSKLEAYPTVLPGWMMSDEHPIDPAIKDALNYETAIHRTYKSQIGQSVSVWIIGWTSQAQVLTYHHPDICLPGAGWVPLERGTVAIPLQNKASILATTHRMQHASRELAVVYWTQEGRRIWTDDDEQQAMNGVGYKGLLEGLKRFGQPTDASSRQRRIVVSLGTNRSSADGLAELHDCARCIAAELYRLYPDLQPIP